MRLIADAMPQIVWIAAPDGIIEYFNRAWLDFSGHALEQSLGQGWESVLHPDDLDRCRTRWLTAVQISAQFETECRFRRASDRAYRWHLCRAHALKDEAGTTVKWIGSCTDIDDQKAAQQALQEAVADVERQVRERTAELLTTNMQLLDAISERRQASAIHEQDTQRLNDIIATQAMLVQAGLNMPSFLNLAVEKIHRLTGAAGAVVELVEGDNLVYAAATGNTAQFVGLRLKISGSLSGLCIQRRQILRCDDTSNDPRVDLAACRKIGAASMLVAPLYNNGAAIGVLKILSSVPDAFGQRDVQTLELMAGLLGAAIAQQAHMQSSERLLAERTEALATLQAEVENRLRSERQLYSIERHTRMILESSHDALFSVNRDRLIVDWNDQAEILFGWTRAEAAGRHFAALLVAEDEKADFVSQAEQIIGRGEAAIAGKRVALAVRHRLGQRVPVELLISPLYDSDADIVYFFVRDLSARKQAEARLFRKELAFRAIADKLPAWVAYIDAQQRYRYANGYYLTESGINPAELLGRSLMDIVGARRYAGMKDWIGKVMNGMEVRYERIDHTNRGAVRKQVHYLPDIDENGTVAGFYSIVAKAGNGMMPNASG